jgi:hypothetical protein
VRYCALKEKNMRNIKQFSLAAVLALVVMAFAGFGTASATALYNGNNTRLSAGSRIAASLAAGSSANLTTTENATLDTCTSSSIEVEVTNAGGVGVNVVGKITALEWPNKCTEPTETWELGKLEISQLGTGTNGTVVGKESIVKVNTTIFGAVCEYTTGEGTDLGELQGATGEGSATLAVAAVIKAKNSFFCPDAKWSAKYTVTVPKGLHVEAS